LGGGLQSNLGSSDQFLLTNIKLSKFPTCKQHLCKFLNILVKEKIFSISIWDPTIHRIWPIKKPTQGKTVSCFVHYWKGH
jgi:hypothetical protein